MDNEVTITLMTRPEEGEFAGCLHYPPRTRIHRNSAANPWKMGFIERLRIWSIMKQGAFVLHILY